MGALLLDLQGLKGELPRIMPGGEEVSGPQSVLGGVSRFSSDSALMAGTGSTMDHYAATLRATCHSAKKETVLGRPN